MAQAASRTPIDPALVHDPAQVALDQARLDATIDLVSEDVARRAIKGTGRRARRDTMRDFVQHPLQALRSAVRFPFELAGWLLYALVHWNSHPRPKHSKERPPSDTDIVRREVATTWFQAIHLHHDPRRGEPFMIGLGEDLFPPFLQHDPTLRSFGSWTALIVHDCQGDLDAEGARELIAAFAVRVKATIAAQGALDLPLGIVVRKDGTRYIAERRSA